MNTEVDGYIVFDKMEFDGIVFEFTITDRGDIDLIACKGESYYFEKCDDILLSPFLGARVFRRVKRGVLRAISTHPDMTLKMACDNEWSYNFFKKTFKKYGFVPIKETESDGSIPLIARNY